MGCHPSLFSSFLTAWVAFLQLFCLLLPISWLFAAFWLLSGPYLTSFVLLLSAFFWAAFRASFCAFGFPFTFS